LLKILNSTNLGLVYLFKGNFTGYFFKKKKKLENFIEVQVYENFKYIHCKNEYALSNQ